MERNMSRNLEILDTLLYIKGNLTSYIIHLIIPCEKDSQRKSVPDLPSTTYVFTPRTSPGGV